MLALLLTVLLGAPVGVAPASGVTPDQALSLLQTATAAAIEALRAPTDPQVAGETLNVALREMQRCAGQLKQFESHKTLKINRVKLDALSKSIARLGGGAADLKQAKVVSPATLTRLQLAIASIDAQRVALGVKSLTKP